MKGLGLIFRLTPPPLDTCSTLVRVNGVTKFGAFSGKLPEHNVSWRGGLDYKINATNLLYANVSRGFKSGSFSNLPGNDESQYYPVKQEQLTAYEVGFKSSFANRTVQLNGALFHYDYVNKQLKGRTNVPVFNFLEALVNIPKSWIRGGEVQVTWLPVSGLRLSGGASYIDTRITKDFSNFTAFGQVINFKGYGFSNTPLTVRSPSGNRAAS